MEISKFVPLLFFDGTPKATKYVGTACSACFSKQRYTVKLNAVSFYEEKKGKGREGKGREEKKRKEKRKEKKRREEKRREKKKRKEKKKREKKNKPPFKFAQ